MCLACLKSDKLLTCTTFSSHGNIFLIQFNCMAHSRNCNFQGISATVLDPFVFQSRWAELLSFKSAKLLSLLTVLYPVLALASAIFIYLIRTGSSSCKREAFFFRVLCLGGAGCPMSALLWFILRFLAVRGSGYDQRRFNNFFAGLQLLYIIGV